jgi:hypothetical protein
MKTPDPYSLKHKPVFLLPYEEHDGPFARETDCKFLSVGWAQYDPGGISVKTLRHTDIKWSRQSEELPIHRAIDLVLLLANAVRVGGGRIEFPAGTLENQPGVVAIDATLANTAQAKDFNAKLHDKAVLQRLGVLLHTLEGMRTQNLIESRSSFSEGD